LPEGGIHGRVVGHILDDDVDALDVELPRLTRRDAAHHGELRRRAEQLAQAPPHHRGVCNDGGAK
jgi:hypothetical protein